LAEVESSAAGIRKTADLPLLTGIIAAYEDSRPVLARHALKPASGVDAGEIARRLIARIHTLATGS